MSRAKYISILMVLLLSALSVFARTPRIMSNTDRDGYLERLESLIHYHDADLEEAIPYIVNPFFFEQPLILKIKAPGGISDVDILESFSSLLVKEISGAFVRGSKRSLLMKSGDLLKEGDEVIRSLPDLGGLEAKVVIGTIQRKQFLLELNNEEYVVDLSEI